MSIKLLCAACSKLSVISWHCAALLCLTLRFTDRGQRWVCSTLLYALSSAALQSLARHSPSLQSAQPPLSLVQKSEIEERRRRRVDLLAKLASGRSASRDPSVPRSTPPPSTPAEQSAAATGAAVAPADTADAGAAAPLAGAAVGQQQAGQPAEAPSQPGAGASLEDLAAAVRAAKAGTQPSRASSQEHNGSAVAAVESKPVAAANEPAAKADGAAAAEADSDVEAVQIDSEDDAAERIDVMFRPPAEQVRLRSVLHAF